MKLRGMLILYILFACSSWTDGEKCVLPANAGESVVEESLQRGEGQEEKIISVLMAANRSADISVRTSPSFFLQLARRYRTAGFGLEKAFGHLLAGQDIGQRTHLKNNMQSSCLRAACLQHAGYYVYALRRIII